MKPQHTPGPWECVIDGENGPYVAQPIKRYGDQDKKPIAWDVSSKANAHLIAAAPDLLEALEAAYAQIIEFLNEGNFNRYVEFDSGYIVDAIAKARGEANGP